MIGAFWDIFFLTVTKVKVRMLFGLAVFGLLGLLAYRTMFSGAKSGGGSVTQNLQQSGDNGFQFRDTTFSEKTVDIYHPDIRYGNAALQQSAMLGSAPDIYGTPTSFYQLIPGVSEISKINSTHLDHLIL